MYPCTWIRPTPRPVLVPGPVLGQRRPKHTHISQENISNHARPRPEQTHLHHKPQNIDMEKTACCAPSMDVVNGDCKKCKDNNNHNHKRNTNTWAALFALSLSHHAPQPRQQHIAHTSMIEKFRRQRMACKWPLPCTDWADEQAPIAKHTVKLEGKEKRSI